MKHTCEHCRHFTNTCHRDSSVKFWRDATPGFCPEFAGKCDIDEMNIENIHRDCTGKEIIVKGITPAYAFENSDGCEFFEDRLTPAQHTCIAQIGKLYDGVMQGGLGLKPRDGEKEDAVEKILEILDGRKKIN